ncbi:olfactory receptor 10D3-like [Emydura macquarii macquarii]|uniref:olfactory receptor 10D3-like n=1 Tax=Emydura macquarii macquarii TaxID=1129001 RepID=UPI003529E243
MYAEVLREKEEDDEEGSPTPKARRPSFFIRFLAFYFCTLLGNLLISSVFLANSRLHTPMYFFLCNLSVVDLGFASISTPKFLVSLWTKSRTISLGGCMSQVFFYHFLGSTECLLYTVMAFDRYVAICHPLHYLIIRNWRLCAILAAGTLLACADMYVIKTVTFINTGVVHMTCFLLILMSHVRIAASMVRMRSAEHCRKAVSTCASHLSVVCFFFGPCALLYTQPSLSNVLATPTQIFCNVGTLMLNPVIYKLRNKEVKAAFKKMKGG